MLNIGVGRGWKIKTGDGCIANEEWIVVSSGRDRHTGNRTRWRSDTSIFRGSFSPVAILLYHPVTPRHAPDPRSILKTVPETKSSFSLFSLPSRRPHGTYSKFSKTV